MRLFKKPGVQTGLLLFSTFSAISLGCLLMGLLFLVTEQPPTALAVAIVFNLLWIISLKDAISSAYNHGMADMVLNDPVKTYAEKHRK